MKNATQIMFEETVYFRDKALVEQQCVYCGLFFLDAGGKSCCLFLKYFWLTEDGVAGKITFTYWI